MAHAKVFSAAVLGLDSFPVEVESDIGQGLPNFLIVGLPDKAVEESKERVRSAIKNSSQDFPTKRLTVNLAPADLKKEGPSYDLPLAVSVLLSSGQLPQVVLKDSLFLGELSLNGNLRQINGILPAVTMAKEKGFKNIFLPAENLAEASLISGLNLFPVENLRQLILHLKGEKKLRPKVLKYQIKAKEDFEYDFAYIKGQEHAKRALEIAAAGGHNVLMSGPPGSGKTLLARSLPSILPEMTEEEILEVTKIYSVSGLLSNKNSVVSQRPFRTPHHTSSNIALVGGGQYPKPGEITLSHRGVLFLDELPEFARSVLEALRQPLEDGVVTVSRAAGSLSFPAQFILVASQNPCPCGFLNDPLKACIDTPTQILRYQKRVSGPLLDRIDLHVEVPRVKSEKLTDEKVAEESGKIRERVEKARKIQRKRFVESKISTNSEISPRDLKKFAPLEEKGISLLKTAISQLNLSARAFHRIIKLARTISDLERAADITTSHLAEALQYRPKEQHNF